MKCPSMISEKVDVVVCFLACQIQTEFYKKRDAKV